LLDKAQNPDRSLQYSAFRRSSERSYDTSHKPVYRCPILSRYGFSFQMEIQKAFV
jgi:hypothetical protein